MLDFIIARLQEPSSYASLAILLGGIGLHINDTVFQSVSHTLAALAALAGVLLKERQHAPAQNATPTVPPQNP